MSKSKIDTMRRDARIKAYSNNLLNACEMLIDANKQMAQWIVQHDPNGTAYTGIDAQLFAHNIIEKINEKD